MNRIMEIISQEFFKRIHILLKKKFVAKCNSCESEKIINEKEENRRMTLNLEHCLRSRSIESIVYSCAFIIVQRSSIHKMANDLYKNKQQKNSAPRLLFATFDTKVFETVDDARVNVICDQFHARSEPLITYYCYPRSAPANTRRSFHSQNKSSHFLPQRPYYFQTFTTTKSFDFHSLSYFNKSRNFVAFKHFSWIKRTPLLRTRDHNWIGKKFDSPTFTFFSK